MTAGQSLKAFLDAKIAELEHDLKHEAYQDEKAEYRASIHELKQVRAKLEECLVQVYPDYDPECDCYLCSESRTLYRLFGTPDAKEGELGRK